MFAPTSNKISFCFVWQSHLIVEGSLDKNVFTLQSAVKLGVQYLIVLPFHVNVSTRWAVSNGVGPIV